MVVPGCSGCGVLALWLHGLWDLKGPGIEPVSPPLTGGLDYWTTREVPCLVFLTSFYFTFFVFCISLDYLLLI